MVHSSIVAGMPVPWHSVMVARGGAAGQKVIVRACHFHRYPYRYRAFGARHCYPSRFRGDVYGMHPGLRLGRLFKMRLWFGSRRVLSSFNWLGGLLRHRQPHSGGFTVRPDMTKDGSPGPRNDKNQGKTVNRVQDWGTEYNIDPISMHKVPKTQEAKVSKGGKGLREDAKSIESQILNTKTRTAEANNELEQPKQPKESDQPEESKESKVPKQSKETKEAVESKESKESEQPKETTGANETQESAESGTKVFEGPESTQAQPMGQPNQAAVKESKSKNQDKQTPYKVSTDGPLYRGRREPEPIPVEEHSPAAMNPELLAKMYKDQSVKVPTESSASGPSELSEPSACSARPVDSVQFPHASNAQAPKVQPSKPRTPSRAQESPQVASHDDKFPQTIAQFSGKNRPVDSVRTTDDFDPGRDLFPGLKGKYNDPNKVFSRLVPEANDKMDGDKPRIDPDESLNIGSTRPSGTRIDSQRVEATDFDIEELLPEDIRSQYRKEASKQSSKDPSTSRPQKVDVSNLEEALKKSRNEGIKQDEEGFRAKAAFDYVNERMPSGMPRSFESRNFFSGRDMLSKQEQDQNLKKLNIRKEYAILTPSLRTIYTKSLPFRDRKEPPQDLFSTLSSMENPGKYVKAIRKLEKSGWTCIGGGGPGELLLFERQYSEERRSSRLLFKLTASFIGVVGLVGTSAYLFM
uniref:ARAD1B03652p n=1 Tax=Blastobotrys adeninivorans TaxID=409370 RepID=A0A060T4Y7_BLAAD